MFCYQRNFFSPTEEVNKERFWALVGAPITEEYISKFRETGDAAWKRKLPGFIFQATFDVTTTKKGYVGRWRKQAATRLTGLVVVDVDHLDDIEQTLRDMNSRNDVLKLSDLCQKLGILLVYVTPSGHGLKVVFKARAEWGNLIDNMNAMASKLGVKADQSCKDASRLSFICTREDILFINENELFTYENKEFSERFESIYRRGNSQPTVRPAGPAVDADVAHAGVELQKDGGSDGVVCKDTVETYRGVSYADIVREWLGGSVPQPGDRHTTLLNLARDLRYICDRNAEKVKRVLLNEQWVRDLQNEGDSVDQTIKDACDYKYYASVPKRLREVLEKLNLSDVANQKEQNKDEKDLPQLPLKEWGEEIGELSKIYPCMSESIEVLPVEARPAAIFVAAAFLGTLMTRTWYYFYHRPEERRRLNYSVMVIGDPASGKSFATRLYKILAAPIKTADKIGYEALNRYKEEMRTKGSNKDKPKKPSVVIRDHPARTSNAQFIQDMNNAVEIVDGQPMHLHLLTFDSELDNATLTQRGGSWIDKSSLELKAFHNEEDGQAYSNLDSISGTFNVYWNYVYTGTPLSLQRKVTERNFGSGLATRLACIPLPPSGFKMMEFRRKRTINLEADETLKTWAFRLDKVMGELPIWPIVEETWRWTSERMDIAAYNQDKADELLLKRVAYYGVCVTSPFVLMRHWDEWNEKKTFTVDEMDLKFVRLVMDIQYHCQKYFFGGYAQAYFDNMLRDQLSSRQRASKYDMAYQQLPEEFTPSDLAKKYGITDNAAYATLSRLTRDGFITRIKKGLFRKLKKTLI